MLSASKTAQDIKSGRIKAADLITGTLSVINEKEPEINSFITLCPDFAAKEAERIDALSFEEKQKLPLCGVPVAVKDNICTEGIKTTCASKILYNFIPPYDAEVVVKLKNAGAVIIGKTNMDEFAMGSSCETSYFKKTFNPHSKDRIPGGSSGGSAAAVASGQVPLSIGSDTGGSIRQPAALCGCVGLKPTYGRVSRYGLIAFASSLDQIGPFASSVEDAALLLETLSGYDEKDSTSAPVSFEKFSEKCFLPVDGLKVGIPAEYFIEGLAPAIKEKINELQKILSEKFKVEFVPVNLPHTKYAVPVYYLIATAEASSNLARYDGVQYGLRSAEHKDLIDMYSKTRAEGFGAEVKRRIMLGTYALSSGYYDAYYKKAGQVRSLIKKDFDEVWKKVDLLLTPATPTTAFKIGEKINDPLQMYLSDVFTISANLAGIPGVSVPYGKDELNLPIGVQVLAKNFDEAKMLAFAQKIEKVNKENGDNDGV